MEWLKMPFQITPLQIPAKSKSPRTLDALVKNLRQYSKSSIVNTGAALMWAAYHHEIDKAQFDRQILVINAYGPKIILLGMATANNQRNKHLTPDGFYAMCHDYLNIRNSISNQIFLESEADQIHKCLKIQKNNRIPDVFLNIEHIRLSCSTLFLARGVRAQHTSHLTNIQELHLTFRIFSMLDMATEGAATVACRAVFGVEPLHFIRSAFALFALGNEADSNGHINFKIMGWGQEVIDLWGIDKETCRTVAAKIAYDENGLREHWYEKTVLPLHELYQQYAPDPLYTHPLIHLSGREAHTQFLIPSPATFVRNLTNTWFSQLIAHDKTLGIKLGNVLESHIHQSLEHIFGKGRVTKIPECKGAKSADFHVTLDVCDLIIEMKARLGSDEAQSVMKPEQVADIWNRLNRACTQCAESIQIYKRPERPIICIVLAGDHITAEAMPFQSFAERSGLFKNLGIDAIEFLSWNGLEYILSRTSVIKFEQRLVDKWKSGQRMELRDIMSLDFERDTPAHSYEHLKETELQIFSKRLLEKDI
jgi:hypothetical protein